MSDEIKPENHKLIESAFMAAIKALFAEKTDSLTTEVTVASGTYLLSISLKDIDETRRG